MTLELFRNRMAKCRWNRGKDIESERRYVNQSRNVFNVPSQYSIEEILSRLRGLSGIREIDANFPVTLSTCISKRLKPELRSL